MNTLFFTLFLMPDYLISFNKTIVLSNVTQLLPVENLKPPCNENIFSTRNLKRRFGFIAIRKLAGQQSCEEVCNSIQLPRHTRIQVEQAIQVEIPLRLPSVNDSPSRGKAHFCPGIRAIAAIKSGLNYSNRGKNALSSSEKVASQQPAIVAFAL